MAVTGVHHLYLETHDWDTAVAFWTGLGFTLDQDFGRSGILRPAGGGPYLMVAEVPPGAELAEAVYFATPEAGPGFSPTHWGTQVLDVRDPDGRVFHVEAPA